MANFIPFGNPEFFDALVQNLDAAAFEASLIRAGKRIQWEVFAPHTHSAIVRKATGPGGRSRFHAVLLFKLLVLLRLHDLVDDATSFPITDRKRFPTFPGLTPDDAVPDGQSIADSAYTGATIEAALAAKHVHAQINEKGIRNHPLSEEQKASNREKSETRSRLERVIAQMSGSRKALYQRCIGLTRNAVGLTLTNLV